MQLKKIFALPRILARSKNYSLLTLLGAGAFAYAGPAVHPYWDQGGMTGLTLSALNNGTGTDGGVYPVIAFANARDAQCTTGLASASTTGPYNPANFYALSFGGAIGTYVTDCVVARSGHQGITDNQIFSNPAYIDNDAQAVAASISKYLNNKTVFTATPTTLDFDVENSAETGYMDVVRFRAIYWLKKGFLNVPAMPSLRATFTLPVLPTGLVQSETGQLFIQHLNDYLNYYSSNDNGSWFYGINLMTMDYGPGGTCDPASTTLPPNKSSWFTCGSGTFADTVIQSASSTYTQVQNVPLTTFPSETNKLILLFGTGSTAAKMSVTPMIGQNDTADEQFYLSQASLLSTQWQAVTAFPEGDIRYWSMNRDQACTAPFPVGSASSSCSAQYQSSSFSQSNPQSSFFKGMAGTTEFPVISGATLSGTPRIAVTQYETASSKYTPYYTATITPPAGSSGDGYYMVVAAQPTGVDPEYTSYVNVLKSIDGCSSISGLHPQTGYPTLYSPVQLISNSTHAAFTVFTPPDVVVASTPVLCPFEDYTFTYYTMAQNGDWSASGQTFSGAPAGTGIPLNHLTQGYSGPVGFYNTVSGQSSGVYLALNAEPDWGLVQGQVTIGSAEPVNLAVGNYLYFYPTPTAGTSFTISASYPPDTATIVPLKTAVFPAAPTGTSASANTALLSIFDGINSFNSNVGFVGAGANFTPATAQLSSASVLGNMVNLMWGHISTTLPNTVGAPTYSLTITPDGSSTPAYGPITISDNTASDFNSYVVPQGALTSGTQYNYTIQVKNPSTSNGLNLKFTNGGAFTGSFALPVDISSSFTNTVVVPSTITPSAGGFTLESQLLAKQNVRFFNDTGITFATPFTESVYGATQFANHDCGDPSNNSTNGVKPSTTVITYGQRTYYPTLSTDQDPTSVYYVGTDSQPYCQTTLFYDVPYGVTSIAAGATWSVDVSVTAHDASLPTDVDNAVAKMQSSELVFQPYGSNKSSCQIAFLNIPNNTDSLYNWGSGAAPAGNMNLNIIDPVGQGTWTLQWNPASYTGSCNLPGLIGSDGANFSSATASSATVTSGVTNVSKSLPSIGVGSSNPQCTGQGLYNLLAGGKFFSMRLTNSAGAKPINCTVTQTYAS